MLSLAEQESSCTQEPLDFEELSKIFDEAFKLQEEEDRLKTEDEQKQKEWKTFTRTFEYEKAEEAGFYKITKVKRKTIRSVEIPRFVSVIARKAFSSCSSLTNITIPDSVKVIGDHAFSECANLINIKISNSVTSIGTYAFIGCSNLEKITVETGNKVYHSVQNCLIETRSKTLILGCKNSIIPTDGSITSIGNGAFCRCLELPSITIPSSVTSIGNSAFCNCWSLQSITIPDSVTSIGEGAFEYCTRLTEIYYNATECEDFIEDNRVFFEAGASENGINVVIGANVKKIPSYLFYTRTMGSLFYPIVNIEFEEGSVCESIGNNAFANCWCLQNITLPDSVMYIGKFAFSGCRSLTRITLPNKVTSIGEYAFSHCCELTSITIPDSARIIGYSAFLECKSLSTVIFKGKRKQWINIISDSCRHFLRSSDSYHLRSKSVPVKKVICSNRKVKLK